MRDFIAARRKWAYSLIQRATEPPPVYGSAEWCALPEGSPEKVAAVIVAAECHARAGDELEVDLRREVGSARRAFKTTEDEAYQANASAHRERWRNRRVSTSFVERRAQQLQDAEPRATDHLGGAKDWTGGETA